MKSLEPELSIHLLGDFRLEYQNIPVEGVDSPRLQSLLAYLMLHLDAPQSRAHLAYTFWPDSSEKQALTNLRKILFILRRKLPEADRFLDISTKTLQWRSDALMYCDVIEFVHILDQIQQAEQSSDQLVLRFHLDKLICLYVGDLLPSCYDDWILPVREQFKQEFVVKLQQLIGLLEDQRDYEAAIHCAQRLLRNDPLHEATCRQLMRLYALNGNRAAAVRTYHTFVTVLQRELGVVPDRITREAYERHLQSDEIPKLRKRPQTELKTSVPLVGRDQEWRIMRQTYRTCAAGEPKMVVISGEAGIGKTRLAEELLTWADRQGISTAIARCYAAEGALPYAPIVTWVRLRPRIELGEFWMAEASRIMPELQTRQQQPEPSSMPTEPWRRQHMFEALARMVLAGPQPLILMLDDMQWCDRDTLEWLHYLMRYDPQARLLIVGTFRIENLPGNEALSILLDSLRGQDQLVEIPLPPLNHKETSLLAEQIAGYDLDSGFVNDLYRSTEGNPFFVVEMVYADSLIGGITSQNNAGIDQAIPQKLPPRVHTVLETRLSQLTKPALDLAHLAAVIGKEFSYTLLHQVSKRSEDSLVQDIDELWHRRIIREQGTMFMTSAIG